MATVDVVDMKAAKAGSAELDPGVFEVAVKPHLFHAEVRRQLAHRRAGTHSSKNRSAVSGGGAKPYRQKGTGRARQGSTRAPHYAGGGAVFGPVPRSYDHAVPKKVRSAALRGALSLRQSEDAVVVVDRLELPEMRTRLMADALATLGLSDHTVLVVIADADPTIELSIRNLAKVRVLRAAGLNVYDVLRHERLLVTRDALDAIHARLGQGEAS